MDMAPAVPRSFASPEAASQALQRAARTDDLISLQAIFGAKASQLLNSGDAAADSHDRRLFAQAYDQWHELVPMSNGSEVLLVGKEAWPMPIPLVKRGEAWVFDTQAGEYEIRLRRVGHNELSAMRACKAIVDAEHQYAAEHQDDRGAPVYTARLASSPGRRDGLYWPTDDTAARSPLGPLLAAAAAEGHDDANTPALTPYHGYYYRILTRQGKAASGGERDYLVHAKLIGGFAVLAYPANYRSSGVMSFIADSSGTIYSQDLGEQTGSIAASIVSFDPDAGWKEERP